MRWLGKFEHLLLVFGMLMLAIYLGAHIQREILSRSTVENFEEEQAGIAKPAAAKPDFSLWSQKRIRGYEESLAAHFSQATGLLRIPKIHLEVPVLEGTDDLTLNRGVGRIAGTAGPGEKGNIGIAGHRDGFFRGLKDVGPGDTIEIVTLKRTMTYVVDRVFIVNPEDVSVLAPRLHPSLTLVTCYPFYFVGSAPQRYIVQATAVGAGPANSHASARSSVEPGVTDVSEPQKTNKEKTR